MSFCKSCKADIVWIKTKNGKHMPANKATTTIITQAGDVVQGHTCHWATCPTASQHRETTTVAKEVERRAAQQ